MSYPPAGLIDLTLISLYLKADEEAQIAVTHPAGG